jgi:hypothetical protein
MKKFLIIFGAIIVFFLSWGTLFKLMHWPGSGVLLLFSMFLFAMFFIPIFFIERMIGTKGLSITTNIFGMISAFMLFMGVLFKTMHWPGSGPMILMGVFFFNFPTLILYVIQQFKGQRPFREYWRFVAGSILVSVFLFFWGTSYSRNIITGFLNIEDGTLQTNSQLRNANSLLLMEIGAADSTKEIAPIADEITKDCSEMDNYTEEIKKYIIGAMSPDPDAMKDHWQINSLDNYDIPTHIMCGEYGKGHELKQKLDLLKKKLGEKIKQAGGAGLGAGILSTELSERQYEEQGTNVWEDCLFEFQPVAGTLAQLTSIQNQIQNAELNCLQILRSKVRKTPGEQRPD